MTGVQTCALPICVLGEWCLFWGKSDRRLSWLVTLHEHVSVLNFEGKAISSVDSVDEKRTSRTCFFMSSGCIHAWWWVCHCASMSSYYHFLDYFSQRGLDILWCSALASKLSHYTWKSWLGNPLPGSRDCEHHFTCFFPSILN